MTEDGGQRQQVEVRCKYRDRRVAGKSLLSQPVSKPTQIILSLSSYTWQDYLRITVTGEVDKVACLYLISVLLSLAEPVYYFPCRSSWCFRQRQQRRLTLRLQWPSGPQTICYSRTLTRTLRECASGHFAPLLMVVGAYLSVHGKATA